MKIPIPATHTAERTYAFRKFPILSRFSEAKTRKSSGISKISVFSACHDVRDPSLRTKTRVNPLKTGQLRDSASKNQDIAGTFSVFSSFSLQTKDFLASRHTPLATHTHKSLFSSSQPNRGA